MSTAALASTVTISGLDRLEASALRYAMGSDDPFLDNPIVIDTDLVGVINMLTSVHTRLYGQVTSSNLREDAPTQETSEPDVAVGDTKPRKRAVKDADRPLSPSVLRAGKTVRWGGVVAELVSGNIDEFMTMQKSATAATTKSILTKKYRGLRVELKTLGTESQIVVRLGDYEG